MPKIPVPYEEWRPDIALIDTSFASEVENVFPGVNSYLPFPSLAAFGASLAQGGNDEFTKVLLNLDVDLTDSNIGGSAHTWSAVGGAAVSAGSLLLDGVGDYITTPDHADFTLGSADFTIDFKFTCTATAGLRYIAGQGDAAGTAASRSFVVFRQSGNRIVGQVAIGSTLYNVLGTRQFTDTLNTGEHHVAFVRKDNALKLFIDGVQDGTAVGISGSINNSTNDLSVGARGEFTSSTWMGTIRDFRITIGVARWFANFTPPRGSYFDQGGIVCGLYSARMDDGTWKIYGGTTTKLFTWSVAGWDDVSRIVNPVPPGTIPYNVAPGNLWMFEQFGTNLVAVSGDNDEPQVIDIEAGTNFANLGGSPPRATNVKAIGDFLVLSGLPDPDQRKIIWSAINDITGWTPGTNLCDEQEFPDGGPVMSVQGGEIGYVVQERAIRSMQFMPGDVTFIFNFSRVLHDRGCISKYGATAIGNNLYLVSEDGFYSVSGQQVIAIGADKVNDWFLANSDISRRNIVHAIAGVNKPRVVWVFHALVGSPMYNRQLIFDWSNQRWSKALISAQVWALLASAGLDLDTDGTEFEDALLDSTAMGLDSFAYVGGRPLIGAISEDGYLSVLTGPNLQATLETAERHLVPGMRAFVSEVYPLDDAASDTPGTITTGTRERLQGGTPTWTVPVEVEQTIGTAFVMTSARLHRFRRTIPAASTWTHAQGVLVEAQQDGTVA